MFDSYNAISGRGDDLSQDPLAPAGLLFSALGIGLLIDVEPWNGVRFGNLQGVEMSITGIPLQGNRYDIASSPAGLTISRNGKLWCETDRPVIIRNLTQSEHELSLQAKLADAGSLRLRFHGFTPHQKVALKVNGVVHALVADPHGLVERVVDVPAPSGTGGPGRK